jgi:ribosomal protein S27AE
VTKRFDPLWKIVGEKVALQGQQPDVDASCPHCHVVVHVGEHAEPGDRFACGLCGGVSTVVSTQPEVVLEAVQG